MSSATQRGKAARLQRCIEDDLARAGREVERLANARADLSVVLLGRGHEERV